MGDSSDRHKMPRVYASGAQKRKLAAEPEKERVETISKMHKLNNYFTVSTKQPTEEILTVSKSIDKNLKSTSKADDEINVPNLQKDVADVENSISKNESINADYGFGNDIGLWPNQPSQEMILFWSNKGFQNLQNLNENLFEKYSVVQNQIKDGKRLRSKVLNKFFYAKKSKQRNTKSFLALFFSNYRKSLLLYL